MRCGANVGLAASLGALLCALATAPLADHPTSQGEQAEPLRFGVVPFSSAQTLRLATEPIHSHFRETLGLEIPF